MSEVKKEPPPTPHYLRRTNYEAMQPAHRSLGMAALAEENNCKTAKALRERGVLKDIVRELADLGFRRLSEDYKSGTFALVFEGAEHQMVRLVSADFERPREPDFDILQPLKTFYFDAGFRIEVLPKVHTLYEIKRNEKLSRQYGLLDPEREAKAFIEHLVLDNLKRGKFFFDPSYSNVALIHDNDGFPVPVIIDAGAVRLMSDASDAHYFNFAKRSADMEFCHQTASFFLDRESIIAAQFGDDYETDKITELGRNAVRVLDAWKDKHAIFYPYEEAQAEHLRRLGLEKGKISGVFSNADFEQFIKGRGGYAKNNPNYDPKQSVAVKVIVDGGAYLREFGQLARRAGEKHFRGEGKKGKERLVLSDEDAALGDSRPGFCHQILKEYENDPVLTRWR